MVLIMIHSYTYGELASFQDLMLNGPQKLIMVQYCFCASFCYPCKHEDVVLKSRVFCKLNNFNFELVGHECFSYEKEEMISFLSIKISLGQIALYYFLVRCLRKRNCSPLRPRLRSRAVPVVNPLQRVKMNPCLATRTASNCCIATVQVSVCSLPSYKDIKVKSDPFYCYGCSERRNMRDLAILKDTVELLKQEIAELKETLYKFGQSLQTNRSVARILNRAMLLSLVAVSP